MKVTQFYDMHSGGSTKTKYSKIYIEGIERQAREIFSKRFNLDPENVTCACCGEDFSVSEYDSIEEACYYDLHRGGKQGSLDEYLKRDDVLFIQGATL